MRHRYFLIEPLYADPDVFCEFRVGSGRMHAAIQIYANLPLLQAVAYDLGKVEPDFYLSGIENLYTPDDAPCFHLELSVSTHVAKTKLLRCQVFQDYLDDGAPFRVDIKFQLSAKEAHEFATDLSAWCESPNFHFIWKGD